MKNNEQKKENFDSIEPLLSEIAASKVLSMSYGKLRKVIRPSNQITYLKVGQSYRYRLSDLKNYLDRCVVPAKVVS